MMVMNKNLLLVICLSFFGFAQSTPYKNSQITPQVKKIESEAKVKTVYPNGDVLITYAEGYSIKAGYLSKDYKIIYVGLSCSERARARMLCGFAPYRTKPTDIKSVDWSKMPIASSLAALQ